VKGEALFRKEGVETKSLDIHDVEGKTRHVGIALDVVQVVNGVDAGKSCLRAGATGPFLISAVGHFNQVSDLLRIEVLPFFEGSRGASSNLPDQPAKLFPDDGLARISWVSPNWSR